MRISCSLRSATCKVHWSCLVEVLTHQKYRHKFMVLISIPTLGLPHHLKQYVLYNHPTSHKLLLDTHNAIPSQMNAIIYGCEFNTLIPYKWMGSSTTFQFHDKYYFISHNQPKLIPTPHRARRVNISISLPLNLQRLSAFELWFKRGLNALYSTAVQVQISLMRLQNSQFLLQAFSYLDIAFNTLYFWNIHLENNMKTDICSIHLNW